MLIEKLINIESIILIDDNLIDNFVNESILTHYGVKKIKTFSNAKNALSYIQTTAIHYQLLLLDIQMSPMDGFNFIDQLRELQIKMEHTQIIVLSASIFPEDLCEVEAKKLNFIEKPLTLKKLILAFNS